MAIFCDQSLETIFNYLDKQRGTPPDLRVRVLVGRFAHVVENPQSHGAQSVAGSFTLRKARGAQLLDELGCVSGSLCRAWLEDEPVTAGSIG